MTARSALNLRFDKFRDRVFASDAVDWAIQELIEGYDSEALRRLAAFEKSASWWEVEPLLRRSFQELGYGWPDKSACFWNQAIETTRDIVRGDIPAAEGCWKLHEIYHALDYPSALRDLAYHVYWLDSDAPQDKSPDEFTWDAIQLATDFLKSRDTTS